MRTRAGAFLLLALLLPVPAGALDVPPLKGRVNDHANVIPPDTRQRIEEKLASLEQRTGAQIAVLTIPSLEGDSLEDFSLRVAETWKLGQAGKDNGALLLVAQQDRKMRIEVGYGLEPVLTDLETSLIQRDYIVPRFRNGDFGGGIEAGVDALVQAVEGEVEPAPQPVRSQGRRDGGGNFFFFALFFLVTFSLNAIRSGSWLVYLFLLPFYFFIGSMISLPAALIAAGLWLAAFPVLRMLFRQPPGSHRARRGGGWFIGPGFGGGGGRGGWGGGGGGFSGGGGSFGGGGSSSSW